MPTKFQRTLVTITGPPSTGTAELVQELLGGGQRRAARALPHVEPLRPAGPAERWGQDFIRLDGPEMTRLTGIPVPQVYRSTPVAWMRRRHPAALAHAFAHLGPLFADGPVHAFANETLERAYRRSLTGVAIAPASTSALPALAGYARQRSILFCSVGLVPTSTLFLSMDSVTDLLVARLAERAGLEPLLQLQALRREIERAWRFRNYDLEIDPFDQSAARRGRLALRPPVEVAAEASAAIARFVRVVTTISVSSVTESSAAATAVATSG